MGARWLARLLLGAALARAWDDNTTNPKHYFHTRPDLQTPILTVELSRRELLSPGYFFFGSYQTVQDGPLIYDNDAQPIWDGFGAAGPGAVHGIQVCNYTGAPHLCFFQGTQMIGYGKGHGVIMNNKYQVVRTIEPAGPARTADLHEFALQPDGRSALMTIYHPRAHDLTTWGLTDGMGWIQNSIFQEIDVATGKALFEWQSLDHIDPHESLVPPASTEISGDGSTKETPWDYFHINSIDKNAAGDYLISARHTSTIYKLSGRDGRVLWRLGGPASDFALQDFSFSSQHDARWVVDNATHTVLTLYDNGSNGYNETWPVSRGMMVTVDHTTQKAILTQAFLHPAEDGVGLRARSQGNLQRLANGHVVQGWGPNNYVTEHLADGTPIFSAWAARIGMMIYRVYKFEWRADPPWDPSVFGYSHSESDTVIYASWNGATEHAAWRFYGGDRATGPFEEVGTAKRTGFETQFHATNAYHAFVYAEALDASGRPLRSSPAERSFVPGSLLKAVCDGFGCPLATPLEPVVEDEMQHDQRMQRLEAIWNAKGASIEAHTRMKIAAHRLRVWLMVGSLTLFTCAAVVASRRGRAALLNSWHGLRGLAAHVLVLIAPWWRRRDYAQLPSMAEPPR